MALNDDLVYGGAGNDWVYGGDGNDRGYGETGNDFLYGGNGNDYLNGGTGNDYLYGGNGADTLDGDAGRDSMTGGNGADRFVFDDGDTVVGASRDHITDFEWTQGDKIDVSSVDANIWFGADQTFTWIGTAAFSGIGQLRYVTVGADKVVQGNTDLDLAAEFEIELDNTPFALIASDLVF